MKLPSASGGRKYLVLSNSSWNNVKDAFQLRNIIDDPHCLLSGILSLLSKNDYGIDSSFLEWTEIGNICDERYDMGGEQLSQGQCVVGNEDLVRNNECGDPRGPNQLKD